MADTTKLLTIFGATGNQGGSIIDIVLAHPELKAKYALRGITRNTNSRSAQTLLASGIEVVAADVNDLNSLKTAVRGSYGVFGVTNFWDKDVMNKDIEMRQGKNIFEACRAEGVQHYVFSSLPNVTKLTKGVLTHVDHFDGKAIIAEFAEANKGDMIVSYFQPAMYMKSYKDQIRFIDGTMTMMMPFPEPGSHAASWPILDPRADTGKYVVGLFEGGASADGVRVQAVSAWAPYSVLLAAISKASGEQVKFGATTPEALQKSLPENIALEVTQTMLLVGNYNYYGPQSETHQEENKKWLLRGSGTLSLEDVVERGGPYDFGGARGLSL